MCLRSKLTPVTSPGSPGVSPEDAGGQIGLDDFIGISGDIVHAPLELVGIVFPIAAQDFCAMPLGNCDGTVGRAGADDVRGSRKARHSEKCPLEMNVFIAGQD